MTTYGAGSYGGGSYGAPTGVIGAGDVWLPIAPLSPDINVQLSVQPARSTPVWVDITADVRAFGRPKYGRADVFDRIETAEGQLVLGNLHRRYDRTYSPGEFFGDLQPLNRIRVRYRWNSVVYPRGVFFVEKWPQSYPSMGHDGTVTVRLYDSFGVAALKRFPPGWIRPAERTDQRLSAILDVLGVPAAERVIQTGVAQITAVEEITETVDGEVVGTGRGPLDGSTLLPHLLDLAEAEGGQLFVNRAGIWTFQNRHHRNEDERTVQATFSDDGVGIAYQDIVPDDADIWTEAHVTPASGVVQEYENETASDEFYPRTWSKSLPMSHDADALALAQYVVSRHSEPRDEVKSLNVRGAKNSTVVWPLLLNLELSNQVVAERFANTADEKVFALYVEGITEDARPVPGVLDMALTTSPADNTEYWELGTVGRSVLGTSTIPAY